MHQCWILRLQPRNFIIISESWAANLEKVRHTSVWQIVPKFWFICLFIVSQRLTIVSNVTRKISKWKIILERFVIERSALLFQDWQPNFQKWSQNFKVAASKFNIDHPLTSTTSKTALPNILKIASKNCIFSKINGRYESSGEITLKPNVPSSKGWGSTIRSWYKVKTCLDQMF